MSDKATIQQQTAVPYFAVNDSFEIVYRNNSTSCPVLPHTHNALEIYFTLTDLPDVLLNDTVSNVAKGSLIIIPPYYVHQLYNQKLTVYERYIVTINTFWLNNVFSSHPELFRYAHQPGIITLTKENQRILCGCLEHFLENKDIVSVSTYAEFFSLLGLLDTIVLEASAREPHMQPTISQSQKTVNNIIAYINEHLTENLTLADVADYFFMNKDYLARLFKKHTHATIGHYISMQKISMAQGMLAEGMTVAQVQEKMGFTSYAYFFKFFKKMTGVSPSHYRNRFCEAASPAAGSRSDSRLY